MTPAKFPQANSIFNPPADLDKSQVAPIPAFCATIGEGNMDGATVVVVAWQPSPEDLQRLNNGAPIFLSCIGGLPPHFLTTLFPYA